MDNVPDKVYTIWMLTSIRERQVVEASGDYITVKWGNVLLGATRTGDNWHNRATADTFYPTWEAAHTAALEMCHKRIKQAEKEIASNKKAIKKLEGMKK